MLNLKASHFLCELTSHVGILKVFRTIWAQNIKSIKDLGFLVYKTGKYPTQLFVTINTMFEKFIKGKAAVFIDAANIELSAKDLGFQVDYKKLHEWLSKECSLKFICFFTVRFDNEKHDAFLTVLKKTGYKLPRAKSPRY